MEKSSAIDHLMQKRGYWTLYKGLTLYNYDLHLKDFNIVFFTGSDEEAHP